MNPPQRPLRNFIPKVFACPASLRPSWTILVYSRISLCSSFFSPRRGGSRARRAAAMRPGGRARVRHKALEVAPAGQRCAPAVVAGSQGLSSAPSLAKDASGSVRAAPPLAQARCATNWGQTVPGCGVEAQDVVECGAKFPAGKVPRCLQRRETMFGGSRGRGVLGVGLCIAPSDPGGGSSVNGLNPLSGLHGTRAPFGPSFPPPSCPVTPSPALPSPFHTSAVPFPPLLTFLLTPCSQPFGPPLLLRTPLFPLLPICQPDFFFSLSSLPFLAPSCPLPPPLFRHACEAALLCPASPLCHPDGCRWL